MVNMLELRQALICTTDSLNFEVRLFAESPKARFYMFDMNRPSGRTFFIPHINGVNSPNLSGLVFNNTAGSFANIYASAVERLWSRSMPLDERLQKHPELGAKLPTQK
jgi:hypothetical protein